MLKRSQTRSGARSLTSGQRRHLIQRHLRPTARIREGQWLSSAGWATSAIDLSDGLSGDIRHLCTESRVGAVIELSSLQISSACRHYAAWVKQDPSAHALAGGEDYELLFTVSARQRMRFERASRHQRLPITRVGKITSSSEGLRMATPDGRQRPLPLFSYEHFRSTT